MAPPQFSSDQPQTLTLSAQSNRVRSRGVVAARSTPSTQRRSARGAQPLDRHAHPATSRSASRSLRRSRLSQRALALESTVIIGVNLILTVAAISGLARMLPVQLAQHSRLQVLNEQVKLLSTRVSRLQEGLDRGMDPLQYQALIKEKFNYVPPNQIQVRLVDPETWVAGETDPYPRGTLSAVDPQ